ncbi:hypothetical protein [Methylobacterium sp. ID0610]|uniref:hypothetical protein n=1 Tax=Methylobacterium carpenticola TaxID=3344827 RepID=UPI00367D0F87
MADQRTLGELLKANLVSDEDLNAAVSGYLADPTLGPRQIADGITLDITAAVLANRWATDVLADEEMSEAARRNAVRTAILLARVA